MRIFTLISIWMHSQMDDNCVYIHLPLNETKQNHPFNVSLNGPGFRELVINKSMHTYKRYTLIYILQITALAKQRTLRFHYIPSLVFYLSCKLCYKLFSSFYPPITCIPAYIICAYCLVLFCFYMCVLAEQVSATNVFYSGFRTYLDICDSMAMFIFVCNSNFLVGKPLINR